MALVKVLSTDVYRIAEFADHEVGRPVSAFAARKALQVPLKDARNSDQPSEDDPSATNANASPYSSSVRGQIIINKLSKRQKVNISSSRKSQKGPREHSPIDSVAIDLDGPSNTPFESLILLEPSDVTPNLHDGEVTERGSVDIGSNK